MLHLTAATIEFSSAYYIHEDENTARTLVQHTARGMGEVRQFFLARVSDIRETGLTVATHKPLSAFYCSPLDGEQRRMPLEGEQNMPNAVERQITQSAR